MHVLEMIHAQKGQKIIFLLSLILCIEIDYNNRNFKNEEGVLDGRLVGC